MNSELKARFDDPPHSFSPVPIWWWSGERLDPERLRWQLERFVEGGVYNLVVMNLAPTSPLYGSDADDPPFFSEEWWGVFRGVCEDARELGVSLWFYDQIGFSGANLQGEIVKDHPQFSGQWLERVYEDVSEHGGVECPSNGSPVAGAALPVDDKGSPAGAPEPLTVEGRAVAWRGEGRRRVMLFYAVERGFDYFASDACRTLMDAVHGEYERRVGEYFGGVIVGSFQDELPSMPTWSEDFATEFEARRGYDLTDHLTALWEDYGEESLEVRRDYHAARAEIAEDAFFKPLYDWHEERGLVCGFDQQDPARAAYPVESVELYADYQKTHRWYGAPGSDHHGDAKIHSSLAHLYERPRTWIEAFHSSGWGGTIEETFDWLVPWLRAGANLFDPHAVYYSTKGAWWEWAPPSTDWRQPYWRHYKHFARTVSRLCSALTLGEHVCDVGVLFPSTTVQSDLRLDGAGEAANRAHETYLELSGKMTWFDVEPGLLDRANRDFDVLDDDSVSAANVEGAKLRIRRERYRIVVLPSCVVLEEKTAMRLVEFARGGGRLIAFGERPETIVGGEDPTVMESLDALFESGAAVHLRESDDFAAALQESPGLVEAPVPTLMRRVGDDTLLFVPAVSPRATRTERPGVRGAESHDWAKVSYEFDPSEYPDHLEVRVRNLQGTPILWESYSGERRALESWSDGPETVVRVPFDDAPAALVVWETGGTDGAAARRSGARVSEEVLEGSWTVSLDHTLDNRWGDFDRPANPEAVPLERREFLRRVEGAGEDGERDGWFREDHDASGWETVHATFGPHGWLAGPLAPGDLPEPSERFDKRGWRAVPYSTSRGIYKDPIHPSTLGPKGHVPEEFLDLGRLERGQAAQYRTWILPPESLDAYFALGAPTAKRLWLNGEEVPVAGEGYLQIVPVSLTSGRNLVEFRLEAGEDLDLRAHFALVRDPEAYRRPELLCVAGEPVKDSVVSYRRVVSLPDGAAKARVQVGADAPCRLIVNGREVGRQGGFDPYFDVRQEPRVQPYDATGYVRAGENEVVVEVSDLGLSHAVLVDGLFEIGESEVCLISDSDWEASRDGGDVDVSHRSVRWRTMGSNGDPAHTHLWRRPHPLPGTSWLDDNDPAGVVLDLPTDARDGASRAEWLRFTLPPVATAMHLAVHGGVTVYLDGEELFDSPKTGGLQEPRVELPASERSRRTCVLRIQTEPGYEAGAILESPVRFETAGGSMELGDWEEQGLAGYSGGVCYSKSVDLEIAADVRYALDLGRVRGSAEVLVNGIPVGARVFSPYVFDLTDAARPGKNDLEVRLYNTAGPYMDAASPTHFVFEGQRVSGMFGPVRLTGEKR